MDLIISLLIDLSYASIAIFGILVTGIAFTRVTRKKYPWLRWLDGKQLLFSVGLLLSIIEIGHF
jgi:hypothetical protein